MGENLAISLGIEFDLIPLKIAQESSAENTIIAARQLNAGGAEVILFARGDGTARNICEASGKKVPVLGIPTGVKIQSVTFAISPQSAGRLIEHFFSK